MVCEVIKTKHLKKSVAAIQSKPSKDVHLVQRKLINVCLFHAYDELLLPKTHRIHIDTLHLYFGYEGNNWKLFDEAFKDLQEIIFTWNIFGGTDSSESASWKRVPFFSLVEWNKKTREFGWRFGDGIAENLHLPKQFASFALEVQNKLKSAHSLVLYEQCVRYATNKNGTRWFTIQDLRDIFGIRDKYKQYKDFSKWVLKTAINEINEYTDIKINADFRREGRAVVAVKFDVVYKRNLKADFPINEEEEAFIRRILMEEFLVNERVAENLLKSQPLDCIRGAISYVRSTELYKKKTGNIAGYVVKAIREGYKNTAQLEDEKRRDREKKQAADKFLKATQEKLTNLFDKHLEDTVSSFIKDQEEGFLSHQKEIFISLYPKEVENARKFARFLQRKTELFDVIGMQWRLNLFLVDSFPKLKEKVGVKENLIQLLSPEEQKAIKEND